MIYKTKADRYGGGEVEEDAYLLFHNRGDGEHLFSRNSDRLTISNLSDKPITITLRATINGVEYIQMAQDNDFEDSDECSIYLALVDDEGNEMPLVDGEEIILSVELDDSLNTYSFGLTGDCNPNGNWKDISIHPSVKITWEVETFDSKEEKANGTEENDVATLPRSDNGEERETKDDIENEAYIFSDEKDMTVEEQDKGVNDDGVAGQDYKSIDVEETASQNMPVSEDNQTTNLD